MYVRPEVTILWLMQKKGRNNMQQNLAMTKTILALFTCKILGVKVSIECQSMNTLFAWWNNIVA